MKIQYILHLARPGSVGPLLAYIAIRATGQWPVVVSLYRPASSSAAATARAIKRKEKNSLALFVVSGQSRLTSLATHSSLCTRNLADRPAGRPVSGGASHHLER